jgi:hypothetical protein
MAAQQPQGGDTSSAGGPSAPTEAFMHTYMGQQFSPKQLFDKLAGVKAASKPDSRWRQVIVLLTAKGSEPVPTAQC